MEKRELTAKKREVKGKRTRFLRKNGILPAIVYGREMESLSLEINAKDFAKIMGAGRNVLIDLKIEGGEMLPVLTHDIQINPLNDSILNIDFLRIRMDEKITANIKVVLVGVAPGVKDDAGILVNPLDEIEVSCLPGSIPEKITIDISTLNIDDAIHISDLPVIEGVEYLTPAQDVVVTVAPPTKEEEAAPAAAEVPLEGAAGASVAGAEGTAPAEAGAEKTPAKGGAEAKPAKEAK
ncbi:MAG: 50S ribosomal protein L25 [Candidatus Margulisiibacteriota bacterium]